MITKVINQVTNETYLNILHTDTFRMVLTRQEKEREILNLYNQGKTYKQITEIVRVSPRSIKPVLEKAEKEREKELGINTQEGNNGGTGNQKPNIKEDIHLQSSISLILRRQNPIRCCN